MPDENGAVRWRLNALEKGLEVKADMKDVNAVGEQLRGLRTEIREQFGVVNRRIDKQNEDREEDRRQSSRDKRQMIYVFMGFGVTIVATLIGSGHLG